MTIPPTVAMLVGPTSWYSGLLHFTMHSKTCHQPYEKLVSQKVVFGPIRQGGLSSQVKYMRKTIVHPNCGLA